MTRSSDQVYDIIIETLEPNLTPNEVDLRPEYNKRMTGVSASTMPCGIGVRSYNLYVKQNYAGSLDYSVDYDFFPWYRKFLSFLPPKQVTHRMRTHTIATKAGLKGELDRKLDAVKLRMHEYRKWTLPERQSQDLFLHYIDKTIKHMGRDFNHVREYLNEHEKKGVGGGIKWSELRAFSRKQWLEIRSMQIEHLTYLYDHPGYHDPTPYNLGQRARGGESDKLTTHYDGKVEFTRNVMFKFSRSGYGIWIANKKAWYTDLYAGIDEIIQPEGEMIYPDMLGGATYTVARDLFLEHGSTFKAYDGKKFDAGSGIILGKKFSPIMTNIDGINVMPSGCIWTSPNNTAAMTQILRKARGYKMVKSDDGNTWDATNIPNTYPCEFQPMDTELGFILGTAYGNPKIWRDTRWRWKAENPRTVGEKLALDNSEKVISIPRKRVLAGYRLEPIVNTLTSLEREIALGVKLGLYGTQSLPEAAAKLSPNIFKSGMLVALMQQHVKVDDPTAWREWIKLPATL